MLKMKLLGAMAAASVTLAVGAASASVVYLDSPTGNSNFVSHHTVGGPVLADDFTAAGSGQIVQVDWWGAAAPSASWEITFHLNQDGNAAAPDAFPAQSGGYKLFVNSAGVLIGNGIYRYTAAIGDLNWSVTSGTSYWFSAANFVNGWTWAISDGVPEVGSQAWTGVVSSGSTPCGDGGPHCGAWAAVDTAGSDFAFQITVPEPATVALLGLGLAGLAATRRRWRRP
jgi:hypothetical protein